MLDNQVLFNATQCYINGQIKQGKVLAIANYVDCQHVYFCVDSESPGQWITASKISNIGISTSNFARDIKTTIDDYEILKEAIYQYETFSSVEKVSSVNKVSLIVDRPKHLVAELISSNNIDNAVPRQLQDALRYCNEILSNFLNPFSSQTFDRYQKEVDRVKASKYNSSIEDIVNTITTNIIDSNIRGSAGEIICGYLENFYMTQDNSQKILNDLVPFNIITAQSDYFEENTLNVIWNNLQTLLSEKLQPTIDLGKHLFDTKEYTILLVELIYKIGCAYGFDHRSNKPEFIAILSIALSSSMLKKMVDKTTCTQIPTQLMLPISSIVTLSIVSYTARCYYQSQSTISIEVLVSKLQFYIESISFKQKVMGLLPQQ